MRLRGFPTTALFKVHYSLPSIAAILTLVDRPTTLKRAGDQATAGIAGELRRSATSKMQGEDDLGRRLYCHGDAGHAHRVVRPYSSM
jgi:hypothetical protein